MGGPIAMVPKQALGLWWTRWFDFNNWDVLKIVDDYESRGLPLDVFVLDMDWHMKNGWTGWTFDKQLFPYPEDTLGYLKSRGLLTAANLHDALGNPHEHFRVGQIISGVWRADRRWELGPSVRAARQVH